MPSIHKRYRNAARCSVLALETGLHFWTNLQSHMSQEQTNNTSSKVRDIRNWPKRSCTVLMCGKSGSNFYLSRDVSYKVVTRDALDKQVRQIGAWSSFFATAMRNNIESTAKKKKQQGTLTLYGSENPNSIFRKRRGAAINRQLIKFWNSWPRGTHSG